ncbi:unnamed protein product [Bursaphelenchus okinawaensis]|uniref:Uncharacterized protein n=1 Tax=Bursaphelenchus okinawaensis TaxID=465554 RepID=A0A811L7N4_9BILA|nr:unnamed protein product [Bursaphelenchus okinawaensis]CAG9118179.1 unnamed protein product [Bursaphelenchus okinawaensis]
MSARCRDTSDESEDDEFTPISMAYPLQKAGSRIIDVAELNENLQTRSKQVSPIIQRFNARATIASGAPRLTADERVRLRAKTPPPPPVNHKVIPKTVAFGRTTKLEDTVEAKANRFYPPPLNRAKSASTLTMQNTVSHTVSAQVQTLQQTVEELVKKVSSQDKKIDDLNRTVSQLKATQAVTCTDIVKTTKTLSGLSNRCVQNEKDLEEMNGLIKKLERIVNKESVPYINIDGDDLPVIDCKGSLRDLRDGRSDGPEDSFLAMERRVQREGRVSRTGSSGQVQARREQHLYGERRFDMAKENLEPDSARSITKAYYYVQREEIRSPGRQQASTRPRLLDEPPRADRPRPRLSRNDRSRYDYGDTSFHDDKERRNDRQRYDDKLRIEDKPRHDDRHEEKIRHDDRGAVDYTPSMKQYLDRTFTVNNGDQDDLFESCTPTPDRVRYKEENLDDVEDQTFVSTVPNNVDARRRTKTNHNRLVARRSTRGHEETLDSDIPENYQTYKSQYHR